MQLVDGERRGGVAAQMVKRARGDGADALLHGSRCERRKSKVEGGSLAALPLLLGGPSADELRGDATMQRA